MSSRDPDVVELAQRELEDCRQAYERGDFTRAVQAVGWCATGGLPIPDWLQPEIQAAMEFFFRKGGATGRGKGGGHLIRYKRQRIDRFRHQVALRELARRATVGGNREDAFERASEALRGTFAQGSPDAVEDSHDKVQAQLRDRPA